MARNYMKDFIRTKLTELGVPIYGDEKTKLVEAIHLAHLSNNNFASLHMASTDLFDNKIKVNIFGRRQEMLATLTVRITEGMLPVFKIESVTSTLANNR